MKESEAEFQEWVIQLAHLKGWRVAHFRPAKTDKGWRTPVAADGMGFPDLVLVRDRVLFVECKNLERPLTQGQRQWLEALDKAGALTYTWRPDQRRTIEQLID